MLCVSVFFIGLGTLAEKAGAKFKSDERALSLIRAARQAIGGDSAITAVQSMSITAQTTRTFRHDGTERTMQGETEIALQLPNKLMKTIKLGDGGAPENGEKLMRKHVNVIVTGDGDAAASGDKSDVKTVILHKGDGGEIKGEPGQKVIVRKVDGDNLQWKTEAGGDPANGDVMFIRKGSEHAEMRQNELLRTTLSLLLSAPQGLDVDYTFAGEGNVDGTPCNIVEARAEGSSIKLYLGKDSNLPVMMSYIGNDLPQMMHFEKAAPAGGDAEKGNVIFTRKLDAPGSVEVQVRFSDYRSVAGLQLPYRWVQSVNGSIDETTEVTNYEINPANIADKFRGEKVMLRTKQPADQ